MPAEMTAAGLASAIRDSDYRGQLIALRDDLAASIESLSERQVVHRAPLAKQLADVLKQIAELPVPDTAADSVESAEAEVAALLRLVQ